MINWKKTWKASSGKYSFIMLVNTMATDGLTMHGARALSAMFIDIFILWYILLQYDAISNALRWSIYDIDYVLKLPFPTVIRKAKQSLSIFC